MSFRRLVFFLGGLVIFAFLLRRTAPAGVLDSIRAIDWRSVAYAFAAYCCVNVARVERMTLLLARKVGRRELYALVFLQNFLNVSLSFSGDVAYVSLMHRKRVIGIGENIGIFFAAKYFDLMALATVFAGATFFAGLPSVTPFRAPALVLLVAVFAGAYAALLRPRTVATLALSSAQRLGVAGRPFVGRILGIVGQAADGIALLDRRDVLGRVVGWTMINWLFTFLSGFLLLESVHAALGPFAAAFAYTFPIVAGLTPFYVFGGFGAYEASFVSGLALVGIGVAEAARSAIAIHLVELGFLAISAAVGIMLHRDWSEQNDLHDVS